jgi:hypothetical protein
MNENEATTVFARLADTIPDSPAPLADLLRDSEMAKRRRRHRNILGAGAAVLLVAAGGVVIQQSVDSSPRGNSDVLQPSNHGSLTDREYSVAVDVAKQQADRFVTTLDSASATVSRGTVADSNIGQPCTSGTLLHITVTGTFHGIGVSGPTASPSGEPPDTTVTAISITADPESGQPCLLSVQTGEVTPDPNATVLDIA